MPTGQPFASGTSVRFQPQDGNGNNAGAPFHGIWEGNQLVLYYPLPPPPDDAHKKRTGTWDPNDACVLFAQPNMELRFLPNGRYELRQGDLVIGQGTCTAVA